MAQGTENDFRHGGVGFFLEENFFGCVGMGGKEAQPSHPPSSQRNLGPASDLS